MRLYYKLDTIDPVIISQSNATTNNHNTCDFIPGSALLGAVAGQLYNSLESTQSWQVFHTGDVQFGPCFPLVNDELALPIPFAWHIEKGEKPVAEGQLSQSVVNIDSIHYDRADKQFQQLRQGFVNAQGQVADVMTGQVTKTALNNETGTVQAGQLYSYSFIESGQSFVGWVEVPQDYVVQVQQALEQVNRIGRAKNSEFGRVKVRLIEGETSAVNQFENKLVLWCLSDCEFVDALAQNTCSPTGNMLGDAFSGLSLNAEQSYIRSHSISRFNQKRAGFDSQTAVISKGSVLVFDLNDVKPTQAQLLQLSEQGVGINKQFGQGWVSVNPSWWQHNGLVEYPLFDIANIQIKTEQIQISAHSSPLMAWVQEKLSISENQKQDKALAMILLDNIHASYVNARSYNNIGVHLQAGPSANQWRRIYERVNHNEHTWQTGVFKGEHRICKAKNDEFGWGVEWQTNDGLTHFENVASLLLSEQSSSVMRQFLELLCQFDPSTYSGLKQLEQFIEKQGGKS